MAPDAPTPVAFRPTVPAMPGVPEAQLGLLAQPFYRADAARSREGGGVGLGLYLCKLVAQAHGGKLTVRNAHPGLEVCIAIPAAAV